MKNQKKISFAFLLLGILLALFQTPLKSVMPTSAYWIWAMISVMPTFLTVIELKKIDETGEDKENTFGVILAMIAMLSIPAATVQICTAMGQIKNSPNQFLVLGLELILFSIIWFMYSRKKESQKQTI